MCLYGGVGGYQDLFYFKNKAMFALETSASSTDLSAETCEAALGTLTSEQ